ncbi:hypothetical protein METH_14805 [Leisingera methylohalidivorans DSM 14336]|uniref:Uncharacterized protein n=2 Tax=Leisingera methylohalidivorans TaxID=133924 RepID=V9W1V2_9RHOB|nr:hypothetical protein METH_14805 [Leisingera methylohalidivorans DSM 14336]
MRNYKHRISDPAIKKNSIQATDGRRSLKISGDAWFIWGVITIAAAAFLVLANLVLFSG